MCNLCASIKICGIRYGKMNLWNMQMFDCLNIGLVFIRYFFLFFPLICWDDPILELMHVKFSNKSFATETWNFCVENVEIHKQFIIIVYALICWNDINVPNMLLIYIEINECEFVIISKILKLHFFPIHFMNVKEISMNYLKA